MEAQLVAGFQRFLGVTQDNDKSSSKYYYWRRAVYYWFVGWSSLGGEYGYLLVLPFFYWNVDVHVIRQAMVVTVAAMYLGQWIKSETPWPRPPSPPVVRLEQVYVAESTMPSTHACLATALPFAILHWARRLYAVPTGPAYALVSLVALNVSASRLYLGMHYLSDVVAGAAISLATLHALQPFVPVMDVFLTANPFLAVLGAVLLAVIFPAPKDNGNGLRADTCKLLAVISACYVGTAIFHRSALLQLPCQGDLPQHLMVVAPLRSVLAPSRVFLSMLRFAVGLPTALLVRYLSRKLMHICLMLLITSHRFASLFPTWQPASGLSLKRWGPYEIPFYFISYFLIAFSLVSFNQYLYLKTRLTAADYMSDYPFVVATPQTTTLNNNEDYLAFFKFACIANVKDIKDGAQ